MLNSIKNHPKSSTSKNQTHQVDTSTLEKETAILGYGLNGLTKAKTQRNPQKSKINGYKVGSYCNAY